MATLPTLEEAERFVLDLFESFGTRPGESIKTINLSIKLAGTQFRAADIQHAVDSMIEKKWVEWRLGGQFLALTEEGFVQV